MPPIVIALFASLGVGAWVYSYVMRKTGSNLQNSIIVAIASGIFTMVIVLTVLSIIDSNLS